MSDSYPSINPTRLAQLFGRSDSIALVFRERDSVIVDINDHFTLATGLTRADVLGKRPLQLGIWFDDRQRRVIRQQLTDQRRVAGLPVAFLAKPAAYGTGLLVVEPFQFSGENYALLFVQKPQYWDTRQAALNQEFASYANFFHDAQIGMFRCMPSGELLEANKRLVIMLGYESIKALMLDQLKQPFAHYLRAEDVAELQAMVQQKGAMASRRVQLKRKDGTAFWAQEHLRAIQSPDGELVFVEGTVSDTSELESVRSQVANYEAKYKAIVENAHDGVFLVADGMINFINQAASSILDYTAEELIGREYRCMLHPDDFAASDRRIQMRAEGVELEPQFEIRMLSKHGETRMLSVRIAEFEFEQRKVLAGTMRDVTEERYNRERLKRAEERYARLFENASIGIFQTDAAGLFLEANATLVRMFGYSNLAQLRLHVGSFQQAIADADQRSQWLQGLERSNVVEHLELRMTHREGHEFWIQMTYRTAMDPETGNSIIEGNLQDISQRRLVELQMKFQANHDSLTRLPNRARFEQVLAEHVQKVRAMPVDDHSGFWVLLLDLDGFKVVNDSLGHAAGDELLVLIAERLMKSLPHDLVISRYGGDEFAMVTRAQQSAHSAVDLAEQVLRILGDPFLVRGQQIFATASIGIAKIDAINREPQHVIRDADTAMYRAKAAGKNRYEVFDSGMLRAAQDRLALETDLRLALERGEFVCYFQPIVDIPSGRVIGAEALTRWQHPTRGLMMPGAFIHVAEESGLLMNIDWFVIDRACRQYVRWMKELGEFCPRTISVNISDRLFASRGFSGSLDDMLRRLHMPPERLQIEVTETVFRGNYQETLRVLRELKEIRVNLLVDDFGTGYSSLVSFAEAAFDGLKIDRGFIHDLETNQRHRALVKTICQFARDLQLSVVSEGVENHIQADILVELGCNTAQGFRYAPAIDAKQFVDRLHALAEVKMPTMQRVMSI